MNQLSFTNLQEVEQKGMPWRPISLKGGSSILDSISLLRSHSIYYRKHHCNASWCPQCYRRGTFKKIKERLSNFHWEKTRQVVLTVDRNRFKDGQDAWESMNNKKAIANMIWNIKRVRGVKVVRWVWVLEWHETGFPHWHVLIETKNKGMIGGDILREYWGMGIWVKETYFKSKEHWDAIVGYFQKKGYFEKGKKYQSELPAWAVITNLRIRRFSGSVDSNRPGSYQISTVQKNKGEVLKVNAQKKEQEIYEVRFQECGAYTLVSIDSPFFGMGYLVDIPFRQFDRFFKGEYQVGMGYVVTMNDTEVDVLIKLCETHEKIKGQVKEEDLIKGGEKG